jgi:pimeloyl-ACP methyl ester carboxylesterase
LTALTDRLEALGRLDVRVEIVVGYSGGTAVGLALAQPRRVSSLIPRADLV